MISILKKKFVGDALIYSLYPIISKLLTFILIPLYTSYLTPGDYGNLQYILLFGAFLRSASQMGLNSSFWKFRSENDMVKRNVALNLTINQFAIGVFLLIIYLLVASVFSNFDTISLFIAIYYGALVVKTFGENLLLFARANFQAKKYLKIILIQTFIIFILNIVFVKYLELNFQGIIYSYLISFSLIALIFYRSLIREFQGGYNWSLSKKMISYGLPIMVGNIGLLILSLSDRWFIKHYNTDEELGLYSYGYKFADLILVFIVQVFNLSFIPLAWKIKKSESAQHLLSEIRNLIYFLFPVLSFLSLGVILCLAQIMTSDSSYMSGLNILCVIAISHVFYGFYLFHSLGLQFANRTKIILICNGIAVVLNIILNILLIPQYGALGAAIATITSYFIMLIVTLAYSQHYYPLRINFFKTILHFIVLGASVFTITYVYNEITSTIWYKIVVSFIIALILMLILLFTSGISRETFKKLSQIKP
ncbi:polysaccharide biosynthesis C-terminal domain-containing protein [Crocinitomix sp.]|nr:polysaccharide biosynthesis C-terminal domain-containing protein [Crocinitomix sp.]